MPTIVVADPSLVVLIGAAGAGKSSLASRHFQPDEVLSSDAFRERIAGDAADQRVSAVAFRLLHRELERRLAARQLTVVDATNAVAANRAQLLRRAMSARIWASAIVLDLPATREWLETFGVTVLGWKTDDFPAFYSRSSGLSVDARVENGKEVSKIAEMRNDLEMPNSILVCNPVPEANELKIEEVEAVLFDALKAAKEQGIKGKEVTPFLLAQLSERSEGRTLKANIALLESNARVATEIACSLNY